MAMQSGEKIKPVYEIIADEVEMVTGLPVAIIPFVETALFVSRSCR